MRLRKLLTLTSEIHHCHNPVNEAECRVCLHRDRDQPQPFIRMRRCRVKSTGWTGQAEHLWIPVGFKHFRFIT